MGFNETLYRKVYVGDKQGKAQLLYAPFGAYKMKTLSDVIGSGYQCSQSAHIGEYALLIGGAAYNDERSGWHGTAGVKIYDSNLTSVSNDISLSGTVYIQSANVGDYIMFSTGSNHVYNISESSGNVSISTDIITYNSQLTKVTAPALSIKSGCQTMASNDKYAIVACGIGHLDIGINDVTAYDANLTKTALDSLEDSSGNESEGGYGGIGAHVGDYALLVGGGISESSAIGGTTMVVAYDQSLTRVYAPDCDSLSTCPRSSSANAGDYALICGGRVGTGIIEAYNSALTKTYPEAMMYPGPFVQSSSFKNGAILLSNGGAAQDVTPIEIYDKTLAKTICEYTFPEFSELKNYDGVGSYKHTRNHGMVTTIGSYAILTGACYKKNDSQYYDITDAYLLL